MQGKSRSAPWKTQMDPDGARKLFAKVLADDEIKDGESKGLVLIIDSRILSNDAWNALRSDLETAKGLGALFKGGTKELKTGDKELDRFLDAFALTAKIQFWSPGTKHQYFPVHYEVIRQAVAAGAAAPQGTQGFMRVIKVMDNELSKKLKVGLKAQYYPAENAFVLFYNDDTTVVHESTHAIQDLFDLASDRRFIEADGYIAQGAAQHARGGKFPSQPAIMQKMAVAGPMVVDGKATQGNKDWIKAYNEVVAEVEKDRSLTQGEDPMGVMDMKEKTGPNEKDIMLAALKHIAGKPSSPPAKKP
jgi:hypothetical protein